MGGHPTHLRVARRRLRVATGSALLAALILSAPAQASPFGDTFSDYKAHGNVEPCKFSEQTLKKAKQEVPPDIEQYAPDFPASLDAALQSRARGACAGTSSSAPGAPGGLPGASPFSGPSASGGGPAGPAGATAPGTTPAPPAVSNTPNTGIPQAVRSERTSAPSAPAPLIGIGILLLLILVPTLLWWVARWRGWEPGWIPGARYAVSEAGFRAGATWAEFSDWLRLGH